MDAQAPTPIAPLELSRERAGSFADALTALLELCKARLNALVLLTTAVGFVLATPADIDWALLLVVLIGAGLAAFGANALNQVVEAERDARMRRTCSRPLPAGRLSHSFALASGLILTLTGPLVLLMAGAPISAGLAATCALLYVLVYTPMKPLTPLNTIVGAVCGAIPPLIGWAGASGAVSGGAWALGAILFVWQIPHFLSLAWLYRGDYERGGFQMLPLRDPSGRLTAQNTLLYSIALAPVGMSLSVLGDASPLYALVAAGLTALLVIPAARFAFDRSDAAARRVFLASVIYLPLLLLVMVLDRIWRL